jgi:undecaprenyl-diphosphatase
MLEQLLHFDRQFFRLINDRWHNSFFDWLMPLLRTPVFWSPLYIFLLFFLIFNYKKKAGWLILFAVITAALTDQVSSTLIKHNIHRLRPCAEEAIALWRRALVACGGNSSFTSSHAANHFGLAVFFYLTAKDLFGRYIYLFFVWAFLVCYAQVYVGVHYPFDVICGAIVGAIVAFIVAYIYKKAILRSSHGLPPI